MQNKKVNTIFILVLLALFESCTFTSTENVVSYEEFPKEISLSADSVSMQKTYDNLFMNLSGGKLVVSSYKADTMMHFYSTPALDYLYSAGVKGHGKDEMQSFPTFCKSMKSDLYVRGFTSNSIRKFTVLDDKLVEKEKYELSLNDVPNDMYIQNDSLLYYNDLVHNEIKCYCINNNKTSHTFLLADLYDTPPNNEVLSGTLCMNDRLAIYAFQYKREIVVAKSKDLSYIKTVRWKYENQDSEISRQDGHPCLYYTDGYCTSDRYYLLYRGANSKQKNVRFAIEVYDKDFLPLCKYNLDRKIFNIVVDEANGYIYGLGESDDYIFRYKF